VIVIRAAKTKFLMSLWPQRERGWGRIKHSWVRLLAITKIQMQTWPWLDRNLKP